MAQSNQTYHPLEDEPYMNKAQLEYFRHKLLKWRDELMQESLKTIHHLQEDSHNEADVNDRATTETDRAFELRTRDRERKLVVKIDEALDRIQNGSYGFCEDTGIAIGIARLEARPIATLCLEAQERHERMERVHRDE